MSSEEWMQVKKVFSELASSDGAARLSRLHAFEEPMRRQLEWLLANHDEATDEEDYILNKPVLDSPGFLQWLGNAQVFAPGQVLLERFEIIRLIGRGGMGEVYEALDKDHPELIAIKTIRLELLSDPGVRERFRTEVQRSRQVSHENICRVHELFIGTAGTDWHLPFFSMELLRGDTLHERVRRNGPLLPWEARDVAHQICAGLEAAHRCGVVHRDLKSSNIILLRSSDGGNRLHAKITDFGLARAVPPANRDSNVTATLPDGAGTLPYMAPELLEGKSANTASDIYALGVVLFRMVTTRYPFESSDNLLSATMRLRHPAPSPRTYVADLSRAWERTILSCLAADPKTRPESASQVAQLLQDVPSALWSHRKRVVARQIQRRPFLLSVLASGVGATGLWTAKKTPPFINKQITALVEDFESFDLGGALGRSARNMFRVAFSRSESVRVVRPDAVMAAAKALNVGAVAIRGEAALRIARHTKADVVVRGSLERSDTGFFHLRLDAHRPEEARKLLTIEDSAKDQQQLAPMVERAAGNLQVGLTGGSLAAFQTGMPRVEPADTLRPDALELFTAGLEYFQYGDHSTALAYLEQATSVDPNFAMGYVYQAMAQSALRREDLEFSLISRAYALRNRVNERQRMQMDAFYHDRRGDRSTALDQYRALIAMYPGEAHLRVTMAHLCASMDRLAELEQHARTAVELAPHAALNYMILATGLAQAGKVEEAFQVLARGRQQCSDSPLFLLSESAVRMISGDPAGTLAALQALERVPGYSAHTRWRRVNCLLAYGRLAEARTRLETDIVVNQVAGETVWLDYSRYHLASVLNLQGEREGAVEQATLLASRPPEPYHLFALRGAAEIAAESRSADVLALALDKVRQVRDRYPSIHLDAVLLHARALHAGLAGRTNDEKAMIAQAHDIWPDIANTWTFADVCRRRREFTEAVALYESVIARRGAAMRFEGQIHLVRSYAKAGQCYQALGNASKALANFDEFLRHWGIETNLDVVRRIRAEREATSSEA